MFARLSSRRRSLAVLLAFALAIAGLVGSGSNAAAATCSTGSDGSIAVVLDEDPAVENRLSMTSGGELIVDGVNCGVPVDAVVIQDFTPTTAANKQIVIGATESWEDVFVVMLLGVVAGPAAVVGAEYDVTVMTSDADEDIRFVDDVNGGIIQVFRAGNNVPQLQVGGINDPIDLTMRLGAGDDTFNLSGSFNNAVIVGLEVSGNAGADTLNGTALADTLTGGQGADIIRGRGGADTIRGHSGADTIRGGGGDDIIRAGSGADRVFGNAGDDNIRGQGGDDNLRGGPGSDFIHGGRGEDNIRGNGGNDTFKTNNDGFVDTVSGGAGADDTCNRCDSTDRVWASVENR